MNLNPRMLSDRINRWRWIIKISQHLWTGLAHPVKRSPLKPKGHRAADSFMQIATKIKFSFSSILTTIFREFQKCEKLLGLLTFTDTRRWRLRLGFMTELIQYSNRFLGLDIVWFGRPLRVVPPRFIGRSFEKCFLKVVGGVLVGVQTPVRDVIADNVVQQVR